MNSGVLPEWDASNKRWNAFFTEEMASRMVAPGKKKGVRKRRRRKMINQCIALINAEKADQTWDASPSSCLPLTTPCQLSFPPFLDTTLQTQKM